MYGDCRDADGDHLNTRNEVLATESLIPVTLDDQGRKVTSGLWFDPYTGLTFIDPGDIDIDHLVPLRKPTRAERMLGTMTSAGSIPTIWTTPAT